MTDDEGLLRARSAWKARLQGRVHGRSFGRSGRTARLVATVSYHTMLGAGMRYVTLAEGRSPWDEILAVAKDRPARQGAKEAGRHTLLLPDAPTAEVAACRWFGSAARSPLQRRERASGSRDGARSPVRLEVAIAGSKARAQPLHLLPSVAAVSRRGGAEGEIQTDYSRI